MVISPGLLPFPAHQPAQANPQTLTLTLLSLLLSPSWLLQDPDMKLRTTYHGFTKAVDLYFDHLMSRVVPLQVKEKEKAF